MPRLSIRIVLLFLIGWVVTACNLGTPPPTPVPTLDNPTVEFLSPPNNASIIEGNELVFDIVARDAGSGVFRIELIVDEVLINEAFSQQGATGVFRVEMNWLAQSPGIHAIEAIAYREDGTRSPEALLTIEVIPQDN